MGIKVPDQGEIFLLRAFILEDDLDLRLFQNDLVMTDAMTEVDFVEATFTGYAAENLVAGTWVFTPGAPSDATYGDVVFTSTAGGQSQFIYGYYVTRRSDGKLLWAERSDDNDPTAPYEIVNSGDTITIPLKITAKDTTD